MQEISAGPFNHCSTICPHKDGVLVAWYAGTKECHSDQSVHVIFIKDGHKSVPFRLGDHTGNPVLIDNGESVGLLWSRFEKHDVRSPADKWKYCSLHISRVELDNGNPVVGPGLQISSEDDHLLGRCLPFKFGNILLLPLYNELKGTCVIYDLNGLTVIGEYGDRIIQPTLWEYRDKLWSMGRNFRNGYSKAIIFSSPDCINWTQERVSTIENHNSSLHVGNWGTERYLIWNDSSTSRRINMTIGQMIQMNANIEITKAIIPGHYGAYPSLCQDTEGRMHVTFTTSEGKIRHHAWTRNFYNSISRRGRNIIG